MFLVVSICFVVLCAIFWYNKWKFQYWERLHVPHPKPHLIFGNLKDAALFKKSTGTVYTEIYNDFKGHPYVGLYLVRRPGIMLRDPEIIRDVMVKNFTSFLNNDIFIDENKDPIFGCNPFSSKDELWKIRRARHTPQYTSGRVKSMLPVLDQVGNKMQEYIEQEMKKSAGSCCINASELTAKFTIDNVANCALGISGRTFETNDAELEVAGRKILEPNLLLGANNFLTFIIPALANLFSIPVMPSEVTQTFKRIVGATLKYRRENNIIRNDFFDAIKEYKGEERSVRDIMVMVGAFYLDGFITSSIAMTFMIYELAANPDCQEKLRKEIDDAFEENNGKFTYEMLQAMPYLDAVISEGLRKYPPITQITRNCTKEFTFPPSASSSKGLTLSVGTPVVIPIKALHFDEKYFPNPEEFNPDRFLGENKESIVKYSYLPFGDGPRTCVGTRFAVLQLKVGLTKLISEFEISLNPKTKTPIEFEPNPVLLSPKGGVWIDFCKRRIG